MILSLDCDRKVQGKDGLSALAWAGRNGYFQIAELFRDSSGEEAPWGVLLRLDNPDHPSFYKGRFRPCYWCGVITERIDGCNGMNCNKCGKAWHWNLGNSTSHDFSNSKMKYMPLQPPHY